MDKKNSGLSSYYNKGYFDAIHHNTFDSKLEEGNDIFESYLQGWVDGKSSRVAN